jgi:hypothetical protein
MPARSCRVTIRDMNGVDHSVHVTAGTLFEAVALGLASIRTDEWTEGIPDGLNVVKVSASNVPVEHAVQMKDFTAWLKKEGGSPRESADRRRIREILGIVAHK